MSDSQGRFRVRRGELEIEYEGPDLIREYKTALAYLGIAGGAQMRLEDTGFEAPPKQAVKHQAASHPPMMLAPSPPRTDGPTMSPSPTLLESGNSASKDEEAKTSFDLTFDAMGRANQHSEHEATSPASGNRSPKPEGAVPSGNLRDDKFKDVLRRMGLAI